MVYFIIGLEKNLVYLVFFYRMVNEKGKGYRQDQSYCIDFVGIYLKNDVYNCFMKKKFSYIYENVF